MSNEEIKFFSILITATITIIGGVLGWLGKLYLDSRTEKLKNNNDINTFRYTKLFELNEELNNLQDIDYTMLKKDNNENLIQDKNKMAKVIGDSTNRFSDFSKIFQKARPLFNETVIVEIDKLIDEEQRESNTIVKKLYQQSETSDISKLMNIRQKLEKELQNTIVLQLRLLINT